MRLEFGLKGDDNALEKLDREMKNLQNSRELDSEVRLILENLEDIVVLQDKGGMYLYYNAAPEFDLKKEEVVGKTPHDFFDPEKAREMVSRVRKVFEKGESINKETSVEWKGETLWFNDTLTPIKDRDGGVRMVVTVSRNITQLKKGQLELERTVEDLKKWQKLSIGRELKMGELKKEISDLKKELKATKKR